MNAEDVSFGKILKYYRADILKINISAFFYMIILAAAKKYTGTEKYNKMTAKNKNKKPENYL